MLCVFNLCEKMWFALFSKMMYSCIEIRLMFVEMCMCISLIFLLLFLSLLVRTFLWKCFSKNILLVSAEVKLSQCLYHGSHYHCV